MSPAAADPPATAESIAEDVSLGLMAPDNQFRQACRSMAEHPTFDAMIILLIVASSICLALDVPRLDPDADLKLQARTGLRSEEILSSKQTTKG